QFDLQGIMAHDHVAGLGDLKDKTILVATAGRTTWWPWLKAKFNYTDEQTKPYTFNPATLLRRQERGATVLSLLRTVSGQAPRRAGQVLPVRARRLSALRHDHGHHARLRRPELGRHRALRQGIPRRLEELHGRSGAGQRTHQGRQSENERRAD